MVTELHAQLTDAPFGKVVCILVQGNPSLARYARKNDRLGENRCRRKIYTL
jgi:hypothetical protein